MRLFLKYLLLSHLLFFAVSAKATPDMVRVLLQGQQLLVPAGMELVHYSSRGGRLHQSLEIKYNNSGFSGFIGMTTLPLSSLQLNEKCKANDFLKAVYRGEASACSIVNMRAFQAVYIQGYQLGWFEREGGDLYYSLASEDEDSSFLLSSQVIEFDGLEPSLLLVTTDIHQLSLLKMLAGGVTEK